jgi:DNA (cytosine-5)-methyltransferase 1
MIRVIDLFAGCGGFSTGFKKAGFNVIGAVEIDNTIAKTYLNNHKTTKLYIDDIKNIDKKKVFKNGDADIIIGGPPCQGFSMAGARIRNGFIKDNRNYLFKHYFNIVKEVRPKVFVIENVKGIYSMEGGKIFNQIIKLFVSIGYCVQHKIINASDFGVPQDRERVIIFGCLNKNKK